MTRRHSGIELKTKSTFIVIEKEILSQIGCCAHVPKFISAKITGKIRGLVLESETSFNH